MDTKALRQKILDLAIRGKLVPQDPNDEPASVLLERIREEKKQMVKEGKLKAKDIKNDTIIFKGEDNLHYEKFQDGTVKCIEDEIPFDIPEDWEWVRHNDIVDISGGSQPPKSNFIDYPKEGYIRLFQIRDYGAKPVPVYIPIETASKTTNKGDILLARYGASLGKVFLAEEGAYNVAMAKVCPLFASNLVLNDFLFFYYHTSLYRNLIFSISRSAQNGFNKEDLNGLLIPIPPINEQKRIVEHVSNTLKYVDSIAASKDELSSFLEYTKKKVLDLAIRGLLVPQNPDDEPASTLIEKIRIEKESLIKQGKLKRDKKESIIYKGDDNSYYEKLSDGTVMNIDDELPFEIPDTWCWIRLSSLCIKEIKRGKAPKYVDKSNTLVFAQKCNLKKGGIDYTLSQYLDETTISRYDESEYLQKHDTVINSTGTGTLGRVGFIDSLAEYPIVPDSHVTTIRVSSEMNQLYVFALLKSLQSVLEKSGEGSTNQKELKPKTLQDIFVPIPPVEEQKKICKAVHNSYNLIKNIEDSIN